MAEYKCPSCNADINTSDGKIKCPACGNVYDEETLREYEGELKRKSFEKIEWGDYSPSGRLSEGYLFYSCKDCGGRFFTLKGQEDVGEERCPYCDTALTPQKEKLSALKPDTVLPFVLDKAAAGETMRRFCRLKPLLPNDFAGDSRAEEIKALYVPFWLFSCEAKGRLRSDGVKVRKQKDGDVDVTNTDHFMVIREGSVVFSDIQVDGFSAMPEKYMRTISPFDTSAGKEPGNKEFSGVLAETGDIDSETARPKADKTVKSGLEKLLCSTMSGYSRLNVQSREISTQNGKITLAMLPVWILSTQYGKKTYRFVVNAVTGKCAGELPISKARLAAIFGGITAGVTLIGFIISLFL